MEFPEMLETDGKVISGPSKKQILQGLPQSCKKSAVKKIPQKNLCYLIYWICLQYFAQSCRKI